MDVILHIGQQKTATSAIQSQLNAMRPALKQVGVLYSEAFGSNKAKDLTDALRGRNKVGKNYDAAYEKFMAELDEGWDKIILSQENLYRLKPPHMERLHELVTRKGARPQIYVYMRRPDEHVSSFYQQKVHGFKDRSVDEFIGDCIGLNYYHFMWKMDQWRAVFGREALHARLFHREMITTSPLENFLEWIGVDAGAVPPPPPDVENRNEGLDPTLIEVARDLTRYYFEHPERVDEEFVFEFRRALRPLNTGAKLAITTEQAQRVLDAVREDNEAFADEYLTPREKTLLLAPPRPTEASAKPGVAPVLERIVRTMATLPGRAPEEPLPVAAESGLEDAALRTLLADYEGEEGEFAALVGSIRRDLGSVTPMPADKVYAIEDGYDVIARFFELTGAAGYSLGRSAHSKTSEATLKQREKKLRKKRRTSLRLQAEEEGAAAA